MSVSLRIRHYKNESMMTYGNGRTRIRTMSDVDFVKTMMKTYPHSEVGVSFSPYFELKNTVFDALHSELRNNVVVKIETPVRCGEIIRYCQQKFPCMSRCIVEYDLKFPKLYKSDDLCSIVETYFQDNKFELFLKCYMLRDMKSTLEKIRNKYVFRLCIWGSITNLLDLIVLLDFMENSNVAFLEYYVYVNLEYPGVSELFTYFREQNEKYNDTSKFDALKIFYTEATYGFLYFVSQYV